MKISLAFITAIAIAILVFYFNDYTNRKKQSSNNEFTESWENVRGGDFKSANAWLAQLRESKIDTIIFHKRTCINCCDFYNILWVINGRVYLKKFYLNLDGEKIPGKIISLNKSKIFYVLNANYAELKKRFIKYNEFKDEEGHIIMASDIDHYCYTQIKILTPKDSIEDKIDDFSFLENSTDSFAGEKVEKNINYLPNVSSTWNFFLRTIEVELANTNETAKYELERFRSRIY